MLENKDALIQLIKQRRSVFPKMYTGESVERSILEDILECANMAPNHRHTEPWRFKVFADGGLDKLSIFMADFYKKNTPTENYKEAKHQKILNKPKQSAYVIAIVMHRDPEERVPEVEEVCAVACAVQNMWLACTAYGLGSYWSSGGATFHEDGAKFLELADNEHCLGFFYIGSYEPVELPSKRGPIADKVTWIDR